MALSIDAIKKVMLDILVSASASTITRNEIVRRTETFNANQTDVLRILKMVDPSALTKRNPVIYDCERLKQCLAGTYVPPRGRGAELPNEPIIGLQGQEMTGAFTKTEVNGGLHGGLQPETTLPPAPSTTTQMSDIQYMNTVIDATLDPSLDRFWPTKSYKHLQRRMNPNFPMNIYVYGETGVGKSTAALHISKQQGRPAIRVNLSRFADVDELFGGMRIMNGTTYFDKGPVLVAMEMGAVLILDECDSADPVLLTDLHPILERKGYLIKKLKKMVYPQPGFCVIATANTKGRGDLTGRYIGTSPLNHAFLDRFATSIHYEQPTRGEMKKIVEITLPNCEPTIIEGLCDWYERIDQAKEKGAIAEHISTRKMLDIAELMMSDEITDVQSTEAKECIVEGTNLLDEPISLAFGELWDAMIHSK